MGTNLGKDELMNMPFEVRLTLSRYTSLQKRLVEIQTQLAGLQPILNQLQSGLPDDMRIMTTLQFADWDDHKPTVVYRLEGGEWRRFAQIVAAGGHEEFYGDGGFVTDDGVLVIVDSQRGVGISVGSDVEFADLSNDKNARTLGGPSPRRHASTLELLEKCTPDPEKVTILDCSWF